MRIGTRIIKNNNPCFIIAEIGTSHSGNLKKAFDLIDAAAEAGADCAKFQIVIADEIIHPKTGKVKLPGGNIELYQKFKQLEQDPDFYKELKKYTEKKGLVFLCTPFGIKSAKLLKSLNPDVLKIASPELNHFPLLKEVSGYNCPVILSTGVSKLKDIETALDIVHKNNTAILHCITSYPAPEEQYNLKVIKTLSDIFGIPVGVSDHSEDPFLVPLISTGIGACILEKHFTLSNNNNGLDDPFALTKYKFAEMVQRIRNMEKYKAQILKTGKNPEKEVIKKLKNDFGNNKVDKILGTGVKELAESEKDNYKTTRRSIKALCKINKGELITIEKITVLRSEKNLTPGLGPEFIDIVISKTAKKTIHAGEGINREHFI